MDRKLNTFQGMILGAIIGAALWALAIFVACAIVASLRTPPRCGVDLYHTPALGNVVECP